MLQLGGARKLEATPGGSPGAAHRVSCRAEHADGWVGPRGPSATAGGLQAGAAPQPPAPSVERRPRGKGATWPLLDLSPPLFLAGVCLVLQTLKIIRYTTRLLLATALAGPRGSSCDLAARLRAFESSIGTSRKAFRSAPLPTPHHPPPSIQTQPPNSNNYK